MDTSVVRSVLRLPLSIYMIGDSVINVVSTLLCVYNYLICEHLKECVLVLVPSEQTDH